MPTNKLFVFNRDLPAPFDKLLKKKVSEKSKYSDKTEATLVAGPIKAIHAYLGMDSVMEGAVGLSGKRGVAEYKSATPDDRHLAFYDPATGYHAACVYNENTEVMEQYVVGDKARDGAALLLAMIPAFLEDSEFRETLELYTYEYRTPSSLTLACQYMAVLCDNMYRRVIDEECPAHVKTNIDNSGNVTRINQGQLDSGKFIPDKVLAGQFRVFARTGPATLLKPAVEIDHEDFVGKYSFSSTRILTPSERSLVPVLEPWYVLPKEVVDICRHAQLTTESCYPMRNFMLRGPAGSGKTKGAEAIAAGLGLPYVKYTCNSNTEIYDFVGQVFPDSAAPTTGDAALDKERAELEAMGGVNYENIVHMLGLPAVEDMDYDPEGSYLKLTGKSNQNASCQDCVAALMTIVSEKIRQLSIVQHDVSTEQRFRYVETDFIRALKHGYIVELQEPSTIMQPGVLVGLNSLLEQGGSITLPTGEIIHRHPDAVVVITTNVDYEGCRGMNQSSTDRMGMICEIPIPEPEVMAQRAGKITGCDDEIMISHMVQVVNDLDQYCRTHAISDGSVGMRGLIDWITSAQITGDPYESAKHTIITKATASYDDQIAILTAIVEPLFAAPVVRGGKT